MLAGNVISLQGNSAVMNIGEQSGLNSWARFLVVEPGPDGSIEQGRIRVHSDDWLELSVVEVKNQSSLGKPRSKSGPFAVEKGDYVYAR